MYKEDVNESCFEAHRLEKFKRDNETGKSLFNDYLYRKGYTISQPGYFSGMAGASTVESRGLSYPRGSKE